MKKLIILGMCATLLLLSGCESTPEDIEETAETPEVVETQPVDTTDDGMETDNEKLKEDIAKARANAIAAGAERFFPDELMIVDVASAEAHSVYEAGGDDEDFNESASDILYQYKALEQAAIAASSEARIARMGYESYDADSYDEGNKASESAFQLFNSGADGKSVYDETKKAADAYKRVLFSAYSSLAKDEREKFLEVKDQADGIKANVADQANYANSVVFFTQGDADLISDNPESAYNNFSIAAETMNTVFETVSEKRRLAQEAIDRAKRRLEDADAVATTADAIVPLSDVEALGNLENSDAENTQGGE